MWEERVSWDTGTYTQGTYVRTHTKHLLSLHVQSQCESKLGDRNVIHTQRTVVIACRVNLSNLTHFELTLEVFNWWRFCGLAQSTAAISNKQGEER